MSKIHIDTRDNQKIIVRLTNSGDVFEEISEAHRDKAQATLPLIEKLLRRAGLAASDIHEVEVETGPGSFTGLRVGISIANAMSFANSIKINGKPLGEIENPTY